MTTIQQSKFSKISNLIFLITTTFAISFVWINYYIKNLKYSLISAIIIAMCFLIIYIVFKSYQNKIYLRTNNSKNQLIALKNYFLYENNNNIKDYISNAYNLGTLIPTRDCNHYINILNKIDIYFLFNTELINEEDFIYIYKNKIYNNIKIFCIDHTSKYNLLENTNIEIQNLTQINQNLNEKSISIPSSIKFKKSAKLKAKDVFCIILNRTKSKNYFIWGLILVFSSIFTPYYVFYNIIGSILLLLSLYSRFNKRFN